MKPKYKRYFHIQIMLKSEHILLSDIKNNEKSFGGIQWPELFFQSDCSFQQVYSKDGPLVPTIDSFTPF